MTGNRNGFSLIELLIAAAIFTVIVSSVSGLFVRAMNFQRRASALQHLIENAQSMSESLSRELRVSIVSSGNTSCAPPDATSRTLTMTHPVNGAVVYTYDPGTQSLSRNGNRMSADDVRLVGFAFCVSGAGADAIPTRVTMPMTLQADSGPGALTDFSLQTTITTRDLSPDLTL